MKLFNTLISKIFGSAEEDKLVANSPIPQNVVVENLPPVDVSKILSDLAGNSNLNWKTSIVDLMKLVGMDSSLSARKQLAEELGYSGDANDSASMNMWLHKEVMKKIAENGGILPEDLK